MANRTIADIHTFIEFIERKQMGTHHSHPEIDSALDAGQKEYFRECYRLKDWDAIAVFEESLKDFTSTSAGALVYPDNYEYFIMAFAGTVSAPIPIRVITKDELPDALKSQLRPVSASKPIATQGTAVVSAVTKKALNIYPQTTYTGKVSYYRTPSEPLFAYTQVGRVITYNSAGSTQLEFSESHIHKVIARALGYLGINMSEDEIINFGKMKEVAA